MNTLSKIFTTDVELCFKSSLLPRIVLCLGHHHLPLRYVGRSHYSVNQIAVEFLSHPWQIFSKQCLSSMVFLSTILNIL